MTTLMTIMEDYFSYRNFTYLRLDGKGRGWPRLANRSSRGVVVLMSQGGVKVILTGDPSLVLLRRGQ